MDCIALWLRNLRGLILLYLVAGLSFVPWGIAYATLPTFGKWTNPFVTLALLGCGVATAHLTWLGVERWLSGHRHAFRNAAPPSVTVMELRAHVIDTADVSENPSLILCDIVMRPAGFALQLEGGFASSTWTRIKVGTPPAPLFVMERFQPVARGALSRRGAVVATVR